MNKFIIWIFSIVWHNRLRDGWTGKQNKVIKVTGWRSALIDTPYGQRMRGSWCFGRVYP